jgi:RNA polymerase sigma-70 factor (ECF subfamily)
MDDQNDQNAQNITALQNEVDLIEEARTSPEAFSSIYRRWATPLYRYIYAQIRDPQDTEDIVSQVFLAAFQALPRYKHRGYFSAWLYGITRNKIKEYYRKNRHHKESALDDLSEKLGGRSDAVQDEDIQDEIDILIQHINALPEADQELIRLRYVAELKFSEIGRVVKRSEGAVKKRIYRIQDKLEQNMEDKNE